MFNVKPHEISVKGGRAVTIERNEETALLGIADCHGFVSERKGALRFYVVDERASHLLGLPEIPVNFTLKGPINVDENWIFYNE